VFQKKNFFDSAMKSGIEGHQEFFDATGKLHFRGQVKEGLANGVGILFFQNGVIEYKGEFMENLFHGKGSFFSENGELLYKGDFIEGTREGLGIEYFPNGDKFYQGEWRDDLWHGHGKLFDKNGEVEYSGKMVNGVPYMQYIENQIQEQNETERIQALQAKKKSKAIALKNDTKKNPKKASTKNKENVLGGKPKV